MPTRCALYARYSSDQQRPESIADQIRHCHQEATRHPDWLILERVAFVVAGARNRCSSSASK
jgi:predicted site-specific integrase-resolvase